MKRRPDGQSARRRRGQSAVEFLIVAPLIIVLMMGALQFALLYRAKLTLNLSTFEAARRGAVSNATWEAIDKGFAGSMTALYAANDVAGVTQGRTISSPIPGGAAVAASLDRGEFLALSRQALPWWGLAANDTVSPICIERLNPPDEAFAAFGYAAGSNELPNDNLMYRTRTLSLANGDVSIQDLNLLHIRVTYCHPMLVPVAGRVISSVYGLSTAPAPTADNEVDDLTGLLQTDTTNRTVSSFYDDCLNGRLTNTPYGFPMKSDSIVRMQSNPQQDDNFAANGCSDRLN